ncbi:MAG: hypothetical protein WCP55_18170 [Lentisphaerota bacterium]
MQFNYGNWARNEQDDPLPWPAMERSDADTIRRRINRAQHAQDIHFGALKAYVRATDLDLSHETDKAIKALIDSERESFLSACLFTSSQYRQLEAATAYERAHTTRASGKLNRHERARLDVMRIIERLAEAAMDGAFADL